MCGAVEVVGRQHVRALIHVKAFKKRSHIVIELSGGDVRERAAISEPTQLLGTYLGSGPGRPEYQYRAEMIFVRHMRGN